MGQNFSSEPVVEKDTECDQNDQFNVAVSSCQGWRISQEDSHSLMLDLPGEHKAAFFAVFDGHGSSKVSKLASVTLWHYLVNCKSYEEGNFKEALEMAFLGFDREVSSCYSTQLAGSTAICVLIVNDTIYCANIGDSRAVACVNCECIPLSQDHKPENPQELKRILAAGGYVLGNRVNGNLALSRAFGDFHYKGNKLLPPKEQIVSPWPDIQTIDLNEDVDFIVLACDGIWDVLSSEEVVEFVIQRLEKNIEPAQICEQLTTRCLATDYELVIGCDNMTVLLVCYTRGRSWEEYCTDIFNKNSKKLGITRERNFEMDYLQSARAILPRSESSESESTTDLLESDVVAEASAGTSETNVPTTTTEGIASPPTDSISNTNAETSTDTSEETNTATSAASVVDTTTENSTSADTLINTTTSTDETDATTPAQDTNNSATTNCNDIDTQSSTANTDAEASVGSSVDAPSEGH